MNSPHRQNYYLFFIFLFTGITGCALSSPTIKYDSLVRNDIQSFKIKSGYYYYFSGPAARPDALLGIHSSYQLESRFWKSIGLTEKQLKRWVHWKGPASPSIRNHKGAVIYDRNGRSMGIWYGFIYDSRLPSVQFSGDKKVRISTPTHPVSKKWMHLNWLIED